MSVISPSQCQCARVLLKWDQGDLAARTGLHVQTICLFETEQSTPTKRTLEKITIALENAGIEFLDGDGVRKKRGIIKTLIGQIGARQFFDDLYFEAQEYNSEICLFNGKPSKLPYWLGDEWYSDHKKRMLNLERKFQYKIIVKQGELNLPAQNYAQYRYFPEHLFNDRTIYILKNSIVFRDPNEEELCLVQVNQAELAKSVRVLFNIAWENLAIVPPSSK